MPFNNHPIGVFDSGLGGLTVVKELMRRLPLEDIIYFGDTARVPYGTKSKEAIISFSIENTAALVRHKVKMVIVACNSSSSYALEILRKKFSVPVIGVIHPGARKAVQVTRNKRIGVIATSATIASGEYARVLGYYDPALKVVSQACPLLVPLAEEGWFYKPVTLQIAREYLMPLKRADVDALILGCTHYPLLKNVLLKSVSKKTVLVDSAREVAEEARDLLRREGRQKTLKRAPRYKFLVTDKPQGFEKIAKRFLGMNIKVKLER